MARKSRKHEQSYEVSKEMVLTALYGRKSVEDEESLENQIALLMDYVDSTEDLKLYKIYVDNGFSGTNFERPEFNEMMNDMVAGKFQAILVKDGSRLGRNYLEVGKLTDKIFPAFGIRFISVNDHYDSKKDNVQSDSLSMPLKNLMNEQYSKDLSRKLSPAFHTKQIAGEYIGPYGPYGYLKSEKDSHKLVIDGETASNVLRIFKMKCSGMGNGKIAEVLNKENILSPSAYRYEKNLVKSEKYKDMKWTSGIIRSIVTNQMYLGHMVQGVHRQSMSNREKRYCLNEVEWIIVKNTHEAIVSQELFDKVQNIVRMRNEKYNENCRNAVHNPTNNLLRRKIYCADCGKAMGISISRTTKKTHYYYRCKYAGITNGLGCEKRSIKKEKVESTIIEMLNLYKKLFAEMNKNHKEYNKSASGQKQLQHLQEEKNSLQEQKMKYVKYAGNLYADYEEGILDIEEYEFASKEYKQKIQKCDNKMIEITKQIQSFEEEYAIGKRVTKLLDELELEKELSQEVVDAFVEKIEVFKDGNLKIKFKSQDEYLAALKHQRERLAVDL